MTGQAKEDNALPHYKQPPIIEVACGLTFDPLESLLVPHYGMFWERIKKDFPDCEHAPHLGELPPAMTSTEFPLPRVWFINSADDNVIQLQRDRFFFNWRRSAPVEKYPRYEFVIKSFREYLTEFSRFLSDHELGEMKPTQCELTYTNHIPEGEGWSSIDEIEKVMRDVIWSNETKSFLPSPQTIGWDTRFELPEANGVLSGSLRSGVRKTDGKRLFILTLSAIGIGQERSLDAIWQWYDLAHVWIVNGFADLTTEQIQANVWGKL